MEETVLTTASEGVATGCARGRDAVDAAVEEAVAGVGGRAELVLAFPSGHDPAAAASVAAEAAGGARVGGMTGNGALGTGAVDDVGCSALALGPSWGVGLGVARDAGRSLRSSARSASADALHTLGDGAGDRLLVMMVDTRSGDQAEAVAGAYAAAGSRVPIIGGAAGGGEPAQLAGGSAHTDSVVAVALLAPRGIGVGCAHGCRTVGIPAIATRSDGRHLFEIDGRPAVDAYLEGLGLDSSEVSDEEFAAIAVTHPLAQPELSGQSRIRHVLDRGPDGSLRCATHIPENAAIEFMEEPPDDVVEATRRAVRLATSPMEAAPAGLLVFDCAGRKRAAGGRLSEEMSALLELPDAGQAPVAGVFSHGEICRQRGAKGDKNHAVVVAALG